MKPVLCFPPGIFMRQLHSRFRQCLHYNFTTSKWDILDIPTIL